MEKNKRRIKGIRIRTVNVVTIVLSCLLFLMVLFAIAKLTKASSALIDATDDYTACEEYAEMLSAGSDYLTEQVRLYVATGETVYAENYFTEINETRRRDTAIEQLYERDPMQTAYETICAALEESNSLCEREIYAMRLTAESKGINIATLPQEIQDTSLSEADAALSKKDKLTQAYQYVYNSDYQRAKSQIREHIAAFTKSVLDDIRTEQSNTERTLRLTTVAQGAGLVILLALNLLTVLILHGLVLKPLQKSIRSIQADETLDVQGAYECQYLAVTYNDIYNENAANEEILRHKAEHDPLTGIMNRGAFEQLSEALRPRSEPMAFLLVDVDQFKEINDTHGHEMGDRLLRRVAQLLEQSFRTRDFVIRMGGDEFAVIMLDGRPDLRDVIRRKIDNINEQLQNPQDDLPPDSLSVGVAFSPAGFSCELYPCADKALYSVKQSGRCGCRFYE